MKSKKSQITVIIVIGILLLVSSLLIYYIKISKVESDSQSSVEQQYSTYNSEEPLPVFVEECLYSTAVSGLKHIGYSGGYYNASRHGLRVTPMMPTESDALVFHEGAPLQTAYWWYFKSSNDCAENCECSSQKPYLRKEQGTPSIEEELELYIEDNIDRCFGGFLDFRDMGIDVINRSRPDVTVFINPDDVVVKLDYPLEINQDKKIVRYEDFGTEIDVELERIYDLATSVLTLQQNSTFFERYTLHLIGLFTMPAPSSDRLPPMSASTLNPQSVKHWKESDVREKVQSILTSYIPLTQAEKTKNYKFREFDDEMKQALYNIATFPLDLPFNDLSISFKYLDWWPIYFDIRGRGVYGELIMPEIATTPFPFIMIQKYNFYYDLSYPVLIEIQDEDAFKGEGYRFFVAMESNIRGNQPLNCSGPRESLQMNYTGSIFCKDIHRDSGDINITFKDKYKQNISNGLILSYSCGTQSCFIDYIENVTDKTKASVKLPTPCRGGLLYGQGQGLMIEPVYYNSLANKSDKLTMNILAEKKINVSVRKKSMYKEHGNWSFRNNAEYLLKNEKAMIQLTRIPESDAEEPYSVSLLFEGNQTFAEISLYPGKYSMDVNIIYDLPTPYGQESVTFKGEKKCVGGTLITDCEEIIIEDVVLNSSIMSGGSSFDNENVTDPDHYVEFDGNELYAADELTIFAAGFFGTGLQEDNLMHTDLEMMNMKSELTRQYGNEIRPVLRKYSG